MSYLCKLYTLSHGGISFCAFASHTQKAVLELNVRLTGDKA